VGEEYRSLSPSLWSFQHSPVTSSLLGPNIILNTLFSMIFSLIPYLNVSDQVSHPYKTTGKIIFLYILIFKFLDSKIEDKRFFTEWWQALSDFNLHVIYSWIEFSFFKVFFFQIFELFHSSKGTIINFHSVTSSCSLISRPDHVLRFISNRVSKTANKSG
jgi:hypothetical protein